MIVMKSQPRMRDVKSKEKIKVTTTNSKRLTTTCETSGNIMRLRVNLMPVLAATKEPVEEEEWKEVENIWTSKKKPETRLKNEPTDCKSMEQTFDSFKGLNLDSKQALNPQPVLPSITQPKPAAECQVTKRCHTPLPPISLTEQNVSISSDFTIKDCSSDVLDTGQGADSRPWIDNPLFSKSRSAEFRLPDISLSSLDALLQTVTQKLGRKRRGGDEGPWRGVQSDRLLTAVGEQCVRQQIGRCTDARNLANIEAQTKTSVSGCGVNRRRRLTPVFPPSKPTLTLTMTKKDPLTSNTLQDK
ncbi:hypothetical protein D5F01_LYC06979 [Larimichthys crocea]|uniref:Uncharacterized protein n=1 Tax=Larimichthys crocea TaxID=215358 RepID=A0A6G0IS25_LARCR|nr:hypothetical protein D5F01_LYC06979 [Larimichthys crocea]